MNIISDVLSVCLSSARAGPIRLVEADGLHEFRGQLHVLILMPAGAGKSTLLRGIKGKHVIEAVQYRLPGFVGTITRDGDYVDGAAVRAAGKVLMIDEVHNLGNESRQAMLRLLEGDSYVRDLGFKLRSPVSVPRRYYSVKAESGHLSVKSRFSCLAAGIFARRKHVNDKAWLSRFLPLELGVSLDDVYDMSMGKGPKWEAKYTPYDECPVFEDYLKFVEIHKDSLKLLKKTNPSLYSSHKGDVCFARRNICDFARIFSWASRGNSTITDWEKYVPYIPVFLYNYVASTLTLTEFEILNAVHGQEMQKDIAQRLLISENYVSETLKKLRGLGLA